MRIKDGELAINQIHQRFGHAKTVEMLGGLVGAIEDALIKMMAGDKNTESLTQVNHLQMGLADCVIYALDFPNYFSGKALEKIRSSLRAAQEYFIGTEYASDGPRRVESFETRLTLNLADAPNRRLYRGS
ncbi:hypothetical protein HYU13_04655 [Candidatus Woesearchaeota archaeon]|nr:hypothetical protein [Candidatus Woesearchaeota archaeon]